MKRHTVKRALLLCAVSALAARDKICHPGQGGLVLPLFGDAEQDTSTAAGFGRWFLYFRALYYFLGLLWFFLGVSIIADIFMAAIETITSKEKRIPGTDITYKVWNATVANLTLMALGSSAPEILLSVIEILSNNFFTGDLGPSTIVGSAAFNLFCIIAVCMVSLPDGETRRIEEMTVYKVTGFFSVFAYIWLLIILMVWTPNVVTIVEALLTFFMFPLLVGLAYSADKGLLDKCASKVAPTETHVTAIGGVQFHGFEFKELMTKLRHPKTTHQEKQDILHQLSRTTKKAKPSRAVQRMNATRGMTGQKAIQQNAPDPKALAKYLDKLGGATRGPRAFFSDPNGKINTKYALLESDGSVTLNVTRTPASGEMRVTWSTRDGTATGSSPGAAKKGDFETSSGELVFSDGENFQSITVVVYDDVETEVDELFYVDLLQIEYEATTSVPEKAHATAEVTIIDDDEPGVVAFQKEGTVVPVIVSEKSGHARVRVGRFNGANGDVTVDCKFVDGSAKNGTHYKASDHAISFHNTEVEKYLEVELLNTLKTEGSHDFTVTLHNVQSACGRASLGHHTTAKVSVVADQGDAKHMDDIHAYLQANDGSGFAVGSQGWRHQFEEALEVGDSLALHVITLPWKLMFATVAPTSYCGGWLCFFQALVYIGIVTAFIGDLAALMGCCLGLKDVVTAITFVALGTSLPDAFASKAATINDDSADAAIGNVTGSNAVNVFLGLGLPWSIAAIYWGGGFASDASKEAWLKTYGGEYAVTGSGNDRTIVGRGETQYASTQASSTPAPSYLMDVRGKKGPDGARNIGFGETEPIGFIVPAGSLGISVGVFTICALTTIAMLYYRRVTVGAELGGDMRTAKRHACMLVGLWFVYVLASIASTEGLI